MSGLIKKVLLSQSAWKGYVIRYERILLNVNFIQNICDSKIRFKISIKNPQMFYLLWQSKNIMIFLKLLKW